MRAKMGRGRFFILSIVLVVVALGSYWLLYTPSSKHIKKGHKTSKTRTPSKFHRLQSDAGQRTFQQLKHESVNSTLAKHSRTFVKESKGGSNLWNRPENLKEDNRFNRKDTEKGKLAKHAEKVRKGLYFDDNVLGKKQNVSEVTTPSPVKKMSVAPGPSWRTTDISRFYGRLSPYSVFYKGLERIVHLDLKGAPPNIKYIQELFPQLKSYGATGILIEYEDMFPFENKLKNVVANNAYTKSDIININKLAKDNGLTLIPLIQTISGLDFLLKTEEFKSLREVESNPSVISPALESSYYVLSNMIQQVMAMHPGVKYVHLGSGEAPGLGDGLSSSKLKDGLSAADVYLKHVNHIAELVAKYNVQPLICDAYFRSVSPEKLTASGIGKFVQPMISVTSSNPADKLKPEIWKNYHGIFSKVWIATFFRGASGSSQFLTPASVPLTNLLNWIDILDKQGPGNVDSANSVKFQGVFILGRARYDHFANLCELLPGGIPTLATSLNTIARGGFDKSVHASVTSQLHCARPVKLVLKKSYKEADDCHFTGSGLYYILRKLWTSHQVYREVMVDVRGIASPSNLENQFASPLRLRYLKERLRMLKAGMLKIENSARKEITVLFDQYTANEWIKTNIRQSVSWIEDHIGRLEMFANKNVWSGRPGYHRSSITDNKIPNIGAKDGNVFKQTHRPEDANLRPLVGTESKKKEPLGRGFNPNSGHSAFGGRFGQLGQRQKITETGVGLNNQQPSKNINIDNRIDSPKVVPHKNNFFQQNNSRTFNLNMGERSGDQNYGKKNITAQNRNVYDQKRKDFQNPWNEKSSLTNKAFPQDGAAGKSDLPGQNREYMNDRLSRMNRPSQFASDKTGQRMSVREPNSNSVRSDAVDNRVPLTGKLEKEDKANKPKLGFGKKFLQGRVQQPNNEGNKLLSQWNNEKKIALDDKRKGVRQGMKSAVDDKPNRDVRQQLNPDFKAKQLGLNTGKNVESHGSMKQRTENDKTLVRGSRQNPGGKQNINSIRNPL